MEWYKLEFVTLTVICHGNLTQKAGVHQLAVKGKIATFKLNIYSNNICSRFRNILYKCAKYDVRVMTTASDDSYYYGENVTNSYCINLPKPVGKEKCRGSCEFKWRYSEWSNVSTKPSPNWCFPQVSIYVLVFKNVWSRSSNKNSNVR